MSAGSDLRRVIDCELNTTGGSTGLPIMSAA
eukprot:CAMPEP_0180574904 /NCGR_PEP_ID=MMETSP1037_2-20121125/10598_1 /TAXON_ID=632150 /ORGANISM="Azadinium spinosum, Strain 3D9" /LENGTH=30 /DNA_ID= /DNA_START= /DNA_END= /DNA_ORIENTATION=